MYFTNIKIKTPNYSHSKSKISIKCTKTIFCVQKNVCWIFYKNSSANYKLIKYI